MIDLHELLDDIEAADTLRGSVEKLVDGLIAVVRESDEVDAEKLIVARSALVMAVTTNTSHIAVRANSPARIEALSAVINSPQVDHAERAVHLRDEVATLTGERDATALLLIGANKDREELRQALVIMQDELQAAQSRVIAMQTEFDAQAARNAAQIQANAAEIRSLYVIAKEAKEAAQTAVAAVTPAVEAAPPEATETKE